MSYKQSTITSHTALYGICIIERQEKPTFHPSQAFLILRTIISVYLMFVWMCANICDKSPHSMMLSEWTSCMNRPSGPSCWRKLSARRRKWWCLLPCRYRVSECVCVRGENDDSVLLNVHVHPCSGCLVYVYEGPKLMPTSCSPGHWAHRLLILCLIKQRMWDL